MLTWSGGPNGSFAVSADTSTLFGTQASANTDLTLMRTRGRIQVGLTSVAAVLDGFQRVGFGMCVVSENAGIAGVGSVPTPITDIGWDGWFWHWLGPIIAVTATLTNGVGSSSQYIEIDSKAMRKMRATDRIILVGEFSGEVGTAVLSVNGDTRLLSKFAG